jgi:hypothetical protein
MKKFLSGTLSISLLFFVMSPVSKADNANPPKIISVEQVSSGPYSIGDVVTFRINYSGGNPGLNKATMEVASSKNFCLANIYDHALYGRYVNGSELSWYKGSNANSINPNVLEISGVVLPCSIAPKGRNVRIFDETGLSDGLNGENNPVFEILIKEDVPTLLTPVGEIKPKKLNDELSIMNLPASTKKGKSFKLPRLTKNGVPVYYIAENNQDSRIKSCYVAQTFAGDIGGVLNISKAGNCRLTIMPMLTDKFNYPKVLSTKIKKIKTDPTHISYYVMSVVK